MIEINKNLRSAIHHYLPQDLQTQWNGCIAKLNTDRKVKIANTGLVSSGKSSLFNVLLGENDDNARFAVGAARTTDSQDIESMNDWIDLADTPGIDVNDEDNQTALDAMLEADIIIMIHNIKLGALNAAEYEWLHSISERMNSDAERQARLLFICNWIDERQSDEDYQHTVDETRHMVFEAAGCEIAFYEASVKRYYSGISKGKESLMQKSNIPTIKEDIIQKAKEYRSISEKIISGELISLCEQSKQLLHNERNERISKINNIVQKINEKYELLKKRWASALSAFKNQYQIVKQKQQEMDSI